MHNQYFQGILQLRNALDDNHNFASSQAVEAVRYIEKYEDYISKIVKIKDGFDFYFTSNKMLRKVAKKLKNTFGGILKESPKLFSRDRMTQKAIYRLNVLFKLLDFKKGDVLNINNKIIKITNLAKKISGINIKTNKKFSFTIKKTKYKILPIIKTRVIKIHPNIEILDKDYQNTRVENKKNVKLNEKVKVVFSDGYWII